MIWRKVYKCFSLGNAYFQNYRKMENIFHCFLEEVILFGK